MSTRLPILRRPFSRNLCGYHPRSLLPVPVMSFYRSIMSFIGELGA
jgi:hypothetical protein